MMIVLRNEDHMNYRAALVFVVVGSILGCSESYSSAPETTAASFNAAGAPTVEFSVPDMMCPEGCGVAVKEILAKQPGAKDVIVDFDAKLARVAIEEGKFDANKALAALVDRQFTNSSLKGAANTIPGCGKN